MSCWVVPSVAAELWGCTIDAVLNAMRNGNVPSKEDEGWTFVDVAPDSPKLATPKAVRPPTPDTYSIVSHAEAVALRENRDGSAPDQNSWRDSGSAGASPSRDDSTDINEDREMEGDWRKIRRDVAALRRAPLAKAA